MELTIHRTTSFGRLTLHHLDVDTDAVRDLARVVLNRFASDDQAASTIIETVLIRDGQYAGRGFWSAELRVVWLCGQPQLSLFSGDGTLLDEFTIDVRDRFQDRAA